MADRSISASNWLSWMPSSTGRLAIELDHGTFPVVLGHIELDYHCVDLFVFQLSAAIRSLCLRLCRRAGAKRKQASQWGQQHRAISLDLAVHRCRDVWRVIGTDVTTHIQQDPETNRLVPLPWDSNSTISRHWEWGR